MSIARIIAELVKKIGVPTASFFLIVCSSLAQEVDMFRGTWFNAEYMNALKKSASLDSASKELSGGAPLYLRIVAKDSTGEVTLGANEIDSIQLDLRRVPVHQMGPRWVIGTANKIWWIITTDTEHNSYVVLHNPDSLEAKPVVLGKLPSKNQDPDFLLQRMINSSILAGNYIDSRGQVHVFNSDMTGVIDKENVKYSVRVGPARSLTLLSTNTNGKRKEYHLQQSATGVTLVSADGKRTVLKRQGRE